jgi:hypothetical protein
MEKSKLGRKIRVSQNYWDYIIRVKHAELEGLETEIKEALRSPIEVRKSKKDPSVYLYYHPFGNKFISVVTKHLNGEGFIITAYLTRRISSVGSEKVYE